MGWWATKKLYLLLGFAILSGVGAIAALLQSSNSSDLTTAQESSELVAVSETDEVIQAQSATTISVASETNTSSEEPSENAEEAPPTPTPTPTPSEPNSSSSYLQRCGPDTYLTDGNIVNVSTTAEAQAAINNATPGTVIRLAEGTYQGGLIIENVEGTATAPIVIETQPGAYRKAVIQHPAQMGIRIRNSSYVHVRNLRINNARFGIWAGGLENGKIENNHIHDLIWKGIQVSQIHTGREISGRASSNVEVACNHLHDLGIADGYENGHNGEGIYVGSGYANGDRTNGVTVIYNEVHDTTGEGIELKPLVTNSKVLFNKVYDVTLVDDGNAGGIAAEISREVRGHVAEPADPNLEIRGNRVWNVSRTDLSFINGGGTRQWRWSGANALRIGGPVTVTENMFWNTRDAGIKIQDIYGKGGLYSQVSVSNNIVFNASIDPLKNTGAIVNSPGVLDVSFVDNLFESSSSDFVGPTADSADEGRGLIPNTDGFDFLDDDYFW